MFHHTFLKILKGEDPLENNVMKEFQNINFDVLPKTAETIVKIAPFMLKAIKKQQELIETTENYYVACDIPTNTYYMCYKNVLMLDIDKKTNPDLTDAFISNYFSKLQDYCFRIYKSQGGYHVFCVSQPFDYRDYDTVKFMLDHKADFYYTVYCYIRGFSVRLNKKFYENDTTPLYIDLGLFGNEALLHKNMDKLVNVHIKYIKKYQTQLCKA